MPAYVWVWTRRGRGPLAGPVFAGSRAAYAPPDRGLADSKLLTAQQFVNFWRRKSRAAHSRGDRHASVEKSTPTTSAREPARDAAAVQHWGSCRTLLWTAFTVPRCLIREGDYQGPPR